MQVSIYIEDTLIRTVDRKAKTAHQSRSEFIQNLIQKALLPKKEKSLFGEVFGILDKKERKKLLKNIRIHRKNSPRFQ